MLGLDVIGHEVTSIDVKQRQAQMWVYKELLVARVDDGLKVGSLRRKRTHSKLQRREARTLAKGMERGDTWIKYGGGHMGCGR